MALQVWMPLTKDIRNQGLNGILLTNTNAVYSSSGGKLGGAYTFNGSSSRISCNNLTLGNTWSFACWVKFDTLTYTDSLSYVISLSDGTGGYAGQLFCLTTNGSSFLCYVNKGSSVSFGSLTTNTWYHVVITNNNGAVTAYLNGVQLTTASNGSKNGGTYLTLGARSASSGGGISAATYYFKGAINDFRIYDSLLSPSEVKELSMGKVGHWLVGEDPINQWKLNTLEYGSAKWVCMLDHLNPTSYKFTTSNAGFCNSTNLYSRLSLLQTGNFITSDGKYEFLVLLKPTSDGSETAYRWTQTSAPLARTSPSGPTGFINVSNCNSATQGIRYNGSDCYLTCYNPGATSNWYGACGCWSAYDGGIPGFNQVTVKTGYLKLYVRIDNIVRTPIHDISGNHYDLEVSLGVTAGTEGPRYGTNVLVNASALYLTTPSINMSGFANSYSMSWWAKGANFGDNGAMMWGFLDGNKMNCMYHLCHNTDDGDNNPWYTPGTTTKITAPTANVWHHFVLTGDGSTNKLYVDGVHYGTAKIYRAITGTRITFNGYTQGGSSYKFNGLYTDFRLYSTVLSLEQVKELYALGN